IQSTLSVLRIDTFFFWGRRRSAAALFERRSRAMSLRSLSEGLFAEVVEVVGGAARAPPPPPRPAPPPPPPDAPAPAPPSGDGGARPAQARTDLVGHDLHHASLVAVLRLPAPLLEATGDDDARALREGLGHVLGHLAPADDVEEARLLLPLVRLAVLPAPT